MTASFDPQVLASNPKASVFVGANAGSGKTSTLVKRVARLLLAGAKPEAVLCVTYTKAGAAEMQRRLFEQLGAWAVMPDDQLAKALADIDETGRKYSDARALFARALETPGGLKIQTIHAFCEKLLRRFPLEAGVSPGFTVLEDAAAAEISARARDDVADLAMRDDGGKIERAYAHFSVELDFRNFTAMFATFETKRSAIGAYVDGCEPRGGYVADVWRRCGFAAPTSRGKIEADALAVIRWGLWKRAAQALAASNKITDQTLAGAMLAVQDGARFDDIVPIFFTKTGTPKVNVGTKSVDQVARDWLAQEQARHVDTKTLLAAATVAEDTVHALTLARAYAGCYDGAKGARGALDFGDLIAYTHILLTKRADAAWVLYKLDGGLSHVLLDEAQDTAPEQWDIIRSLTAEFFTGLGATAITRTVFAVGDEKQSIFSFQGAAPERLAVEAQAFAAMVNDSGGRFDNVPLRESWRSAPEILSFVDAVIAAPELRAGLSPEDGGAVAALPITHVARRDPGGCVDVWPPEVEGETREPEAWGPVDAEQSASANKLLARRIAVSIAGMIARGEGVRDRGSKDLRPCVAGDVLILVRRRGVLFHEIIRALKREGVAVAGADRLKLSAHGVFADLEALGRFARFPPDDLTLAGLLRSPLCDVDEESLFDLAYDRSGSLWDALTARADQRPAWRAAADMLNWAIAESDRAAPFDFYGRLLNRRDAAGRTVRQRILTRMGAEGEEALDAFVAEARNAEARGVRDLETFLARIAASELEIKREPDEALTRSGGEVRVMTVHGAKGLEAPVVILPDTTTRATAQSGALMSLADGGFLWAPRKTDDCPASEAARLARERATDEESARLLYVALTRARDRLIICGVESQPARFERSWYDFVRRAHDDLPIHAFVMDGGGEAWRHGPDPVCPAPIDDPAAAATSLPSWTGAAAPTESPLARYASPSSLDDEAVAPAPSPLSSVGGLGRFRRGTLIHRLLQLLPDLPVDERAAAAGRLLAREGDLTDAQRAEMAAAAAAVLGDPQFAPVFGPGSRAEVAVAGGARSLPDDLKISGRLDRLVVEADRVLIVDFKTNRPAPSRIEDADGTYIRQMALYAAVLGEVFPSRVIDAALVWTDGPALMNVPAEMMAKSLSELSR